jgi:hypothetical protein
VFEKEKSIRTEEKTRTIYHGSVNGRFIKGAQALKRLETTETPDGLRPRAG